jgi:TonB family protein
LRIGAALGILASVKTKRRALLTLLPLAATAMAPPPAAAPAAAAAADPKWAVDWADDDCALTQAAPEPGQSALRIVRTPGNPGTAIDVINARWHRAPVRHPEKLTLSLEPGGSIEAESFFLRESESEHGPLLLLIVRDERFLPALAEARRLSVTEGGAPVAAFPLPVAAKAVAALRACEDDGLARWGIDPKVWHALRTHPVPLFKVGEIVTNDDYPLEALRANEAGRAIVRLQISPEGKPTSCTILAGSGSTALDKQTCAIYLLRARFVPATGADGSTTTGVFVAKLTWRMR